MVSLMRIITLYIYNNTNQFTPNSLLWTTTMSIIQLSIMGINFLVIGILIVTKIHC